MSSQTSLGSMGMGSDLNDGSISFQNVNLSPEGGSPPGESLYDCIAYVIYCADHEKIALTRALKDDQLRAVWLPFVTLSSIGASKAKAEEGVQLILRKDSEFEGKLGFSLKVAVKAPKRLELHRTQLPGLHTFITRYIYLVQLEKSPEFKCCEPTKKIKWFSVNDVINGKVDKMWGPEVKDMVRLCKSPKSQGICEYTLKNAFTFVTEKDQKIVNTEEELFRLMSIGKQEVEAIFADYCEHCFPSIRMTVHSFKDYLIKYGYNSDDRRFQMLFNAFDYKCVGSLDFTQLLMGLILMDERAPHKRHRVMFVFRYYDSDCDGNLDKTDLLALIKDVFPNDDNSSINQKMTEWLQSMNALKKTKYSYDMFASAVGSLKIRGTSSLCRTKKPILTEITKSLSSRESIRTTHQKVVSKFQEKRDVGPCSRCIAKKYQCAYHAASIDSDGRCSNSKLVRPTTTHEGEPLFISETFGTSRVYSAEYTYKTNTAPTVMMELLREFNDKKKKENNDVKGFSVEESEKRSFLEHFRNICQDMEHILSCEERVIRVNSPAYVMGDICGNLHDLISMESILWPSFPLISANLVFLGNYVNLGKGGVECVVYLFSLKLLYPNKVFLLRGRQEVRDNQIEGNFQKECIDKYGNDFGKGLWNHINSVFDKMPFSLIIDESIFCANSGIPNTRGKVQDFNKLKTIVKNPSTDCPILWQLLNNEPKTHSIKNGTAFVEKQGQNKGVYDFGQNAVNAFLDENGFSHIICGNKQSSEGFEIKFESKFIHIFSSSGIENPNNKSAVLLVWNSKIQIIRLDIPPEDIIIDATSLAQPTVQ